MEGYYRSPITEIVVDVSSIEAAHILRTTVYRRLKSECSADLACQFLTESAAAKDDLELLLSICRKYVICRL
jgi:hypothetical protein